MLKVFKAKSKKSNSAKVLKYTVNNPIPKLCQLFTFPVSTLRPVVKSPVFLTVFQRSLPVPIGLELGTGPNLGDDRDPEKQETRRREGPDLLQLRAALRCLSHQHTLHTTKASFSASWTSRA